MVPYYLTTNNYDNLEPPWASEGCRRLENGKEKKGFPLFPEGLLPAVGCCFICAACLACQGHSLLWDVCLVVTAGAGEIQELL